MYLFTPLYTTLVKNEFPCLFDDGVLDYKLTCGILLTLGNIM